MAINISIKCIYVKHHVDFTGEVNAMPNVQSTQSSARNGPCEHVTRHINHRVLIRRHLSKHSQAPHTLPHSLSPATKSGLTSTYFTKNRKTGSVGIILSSQGSSYHTWSSNIKISKRTSDFINFLLTLVMHLICDVLKTNFRMTASWLSWVLPVNACSNSNVYAKDQKKKKKTHFSSHRAWYWCRWMNTTTVLCQDNQGSEKFSGARILLVTLPNKSNSKRTKTLHSRP